ncbi:adenylosuccinate synthase [Acinetobacter pittii]|uniref:adenylosuccinate synthase n=1 Tax=Acinetobacter pittii TaxID=48296 RepID=UPI000A32B948|nr:adenylosuccinate synthase [Acinetobacter pittii]OTS14343.1 adenylosuccinate synthase [Acinetobacter pittii]
MSKLTHRQLCEIGAKFLKRPESANGHGCHFTIIEPSCYGENPDVFGVRHGIHSHGIGTFLLEAKTSRADFLADRFKPHRLNPELGMGKYRYYICPTGLIKTEELPEKWGLIYVSEKGICKVIAGVLSAPKIKYYCQWSKKNKSHFDHGRVEENFKALAFEKRNEQNELNLLTMALARLQDPEQILYMQRNYTRLEQKNFEQENQIKNLQRELKSNNFIGAVGEVGDKGAGQ